MANGGIDSVNRPNNKVNILGVEVFSTNLDRVLRKIENWVAKPGKMKLIITVNPEFVMQARHDLEFRNILNSADLSLPDGVGLRLAEPDLQIIPGRKLVLALISKDYRLFYLGGREGVAKNMAKKYGGDYDSGHQDIKNIQPQENQKIIKKINASNPDVLFVAYGAPWQEKWLWANRSKIKAKVAMGVGGAFDYLVDKAQTPPIYIERYGLEWLWRLIHEPWRWRRQLNLLRFIWLAVVKSKLPVHGIL